MKAIKTTLIAISLLAAFSLNAQPLAPKQEAIMDSIAQIKTEKSLNNQPSSFSASNEMLGQKGVDFLGNIAKTSRLYMYLMSLGSNVPEISRQIEFVALFNEAHVMANEVHAVNQNLSALLAEIRKSNYLAEQQKKEIKS